MSALQSAALILYGAGFFLLPWFWFGRFGRFGTWDRLVFSATVALPLGLVCAYGTGIVGAFLPGSFNPYTPLLFMIPPWLGVMGMVFHKWRRAKT